MKKQIQIINSYDDVTVQMFKQLYAVINDNSLDELDKQIKLVSILSNEELSDITGGSLSDVLNQLSFLNAEPKSEITEIFNVDGVKYGFDRNLDKMNYGMFVTLKGLLNDPINNLDSILCCLIRPIEKEIFDYSKFKGFRKDKYRTDYILKEFSGDLIEMNKNKMLNLNINNVYGIVVFFCLFSKEYLNITIPSYFNQINQLTT